MRAATAIEVRPRVLEGWAYSVSRLSRGGWSVRVGHGGTGSTDLRTFNEHVQAMAYVAALRDFGAHEDE